MLMRVKKSLEDGLDRAKWFASALSARVKAELAVMKLLYQSYKLERKRDELLRQVGQRVFDLRALDEVNVFEDRKTVQAIKQLEALNAQIEGIRRKASELGGAE